MAGLLDNMAANPITQIGLGLLSQGPSRTPINPWQGVQRGLLNAQNARYDQKQLSQQEQLYQMKMQQMQAQQEAQQRAEADRIIQQARESTARDYLAQGDPQKALSVLDTKAAAEAQLKAPAQARTIKGADGRNYWLDGPNAGQPVLPNVQPKQEGVFEGTGIEAQALNRYLMSLPPEQREAEANRLAQQRLTRPTQITTPEGVYTRPGYSLGDGGVSQGRQNFTPKDLTEGQRRDKFASGNMVAFDSELKKLEEDEEFDPTSMEVQAARIPGAAAIVDPKAEQYASAADAWARQYVFLTSGATARQEEVDAAIQSFFPRGGGSKDSVEGRRARRVEAMIRAIEKGKAEGRMGAEEADRQITELRKQSTGSRGPENEKLKRYEKYNIVPPPS